MKTKNFKKPKNLKETKDLKKNDFLKSDEIKDLKLKMDSFNGGTLLSSDIFESPIDENAGLIKRIDHIAVSVSNIEEIIKELEYLGLPNQGIKKFEQIGMKIAFVGNNETRIELGEVYSYNEKTPVIEEHKGLHHIAVKAHNIDLMYTTLKQNSKYKIIGELRKGAHGKVFFFKIEKMENTLFECVE